MTLPLKQKYMDDLRIFCLFLQRVTEVCDSVTVTVVKEKLATILNHVEGWLKIIKVMDLPSHESSLWKHVFYDYGRLYCEAGISGTRHLTGLGETNRESHSLK